MTVNYVVNNHFNNEDHWIFFPHFIGAFLYALRVKSKVIKLRKE